MPTPRALPDGPLYFVGIGGAGQSALAFVLARRGRVVRGADPGIAPEVRARLEAAGATIFTAHDPAQVGDAAAIIATDAVNEANPEVAHARAHEIPVFKRPEALACVLNAAKTSICVAGTHGKTTTTGMIATVLLEAGLNPTILIGGDLPAIGGNARAGDPELIVAESCEAYGGLDWLTPTIAVVTNVEPDHLDFHGTPENFYAAFHAFVRRASRAAILCRDDAGVGRIDGAELARTRFLYGIGGGPESGIAADLEGAGAFTVRVQSGAPLPFHLSVPGEHNVRNALAAVAVGLELGLERSDIVAGLARFTGTGRRFERLGECTGIAIVDDYAHHPTEIDATIAAAREAYVGRRLVAVFQPHLPSRTRDFLDAFAKSLSAADAVYLTDIYLAREKPLTDVTSGHLAGKIVGPPAVYVPDKSDLPARLAADVRPGDIVLVMGAGDIRPAGEGLLRLLEERA